MQRPGCRLPWEPIFASCHQGCCLQSTAQSEPAPPPCTRGRGSACWLLSSPFLTFAYPWGLEFDYPVCFLVGWTRVPTSGPCPGVLQRPVPQHPLFAQGTRPRCGFRKGWGVPQGPEGMIQTRQPPTFLYCLGTLGGFHTSFEGAVVWGAQKYLKSQHWPLRSRSTVESGRAGDRPRPERTGKVSPLAGARWQGCTLQLEQPLPTSVAGKGEHRHCRQWRLGALIHPVRGCGPIWAP